MEKGVAQNPEVIAISDIQFGFFDEADWILLHDMESQPDMSMVDSQILNNGGDTGCFVEPIALHQVDINAIGQSERPMDTQHYYGFEAYTPHVSNAAYEVAGVTDPFVSTNALGQVDTNEIEQSERPMDTQHYYGFEDYTPHVSNAAYEVAGVTDPFVSTNALHQVDTNAIVQSGRPMDTQHYYGFEDDTPHVSNAAYELAGEQLLGVPQYSRKVFMGGLPPLSDVNIIENTFKRFGSLIVDWPGKVGTHAINPPDRFAFLIFEDKRSVHSLIQACSMEDYKLYYTLASKVIEIRPWLLNDAYYSFQPDMPHNKRNTVFLGGTPRSLKAKELAAALQPLFGRVYSASIDTDCVLKYPKCSARVCFVDRDSFLDCIAMRYIMLSSPDFTKRVEVKPNILSDQLCEHCSHSHTSPLPAPFFCAGATCLDYYCLDCWFRVHSNSGCPFHKPLVKSCEKPPTGMPYYLC